MKFLNKDIEVLFEDEKVILVKSKTIESGKEIVPLFFEWNSIREIQSLYKNNDVYYIIDKSYEDNDSRKYMVLTIDNYLRPTFRYINMFTVDSSEVFFEFPGLVNTITELTEDFDLISALTAIENGKQINTWTLRGYDKNIGEVIYNKRRPGDSKIIIEFEDYEEYFKTLGFGENELFYINAVLSRYGYSENIFKDSYSGTYDWEDGYTIEGFTEDNLKLIDEIVALIKPEFYDWRQNGKTTRELSKFLGDEFYREIDNIINDKLHYEEIAAIDALKNELYQDFCNPFQEHDVQIYVAKNACFYQYKTWVFYLKELLLKYKASSIRELFEKITSKYISAEFRYEAHEYSYRGDFDSEAYDKSVTNQLENILEKINDNPEKYLAYSEENKKLIGILKEFPIGKMNKVNYGDDTFSIVGIKNGRVELAHYKKGSPEGQLKSFDYDEFYNFLNSKELFETILKKFKKLL